MDASYIPDDNIDKISNDNTSTTNSLRASTREHKDRTWYSGPWSTMLVLLLLAFHAGRCSGSSFHQSCNDPELTFSYTSIHLCLDFNNANIFSLSKLKLPENACPSPDRIVRIIDLFIWIPATNHGLNECPNNPAKLYYDQTYKASCLNSDQNIKQIILQFMKAFSGQKLSDTLNLTPRDIIDTDGLHNSSGGAVDSWHTLPEFSLIELALECKKTSSSILIRYIDICTNLTSVAVQEAQIVFNATQYLNSSSPPKCSCAIQSATMDSQLITMRAYDVRLKRGNVLHQTGKNAARTWEGSSSSLYWWADGSFDTINQASLELTDLHSSNLPDSVWMSVKGNKKNLTITCGAGRVEGVFEEPHSDTTSNFFDTTKIIIIVVAVIVVIVILFIVVKCIQRRRSNNTSLQAGDNTHASVMDTHVVHDEHNYDTLMTTQNNDISSPYEPTMTTQMDDGDGYERVDERVDEQGYEIPLQLRNV